MPTSPQPTPRICFFTHEFDPFRGGAAVFNEECARALLGAGVPAEILTPGPSRGFEDLRGLPVERFRASTRLTPAGLWGGALALYQRRDALAGRHLVLSSAGAWFAAMLLERWHPLTQTRIIGLFHGSEILKFQRNRFWHTPARRLFERAERLVALSDFSRSLLGNEAGGFASFIEKTTLCGCACRTGLPERLPPELPTDGTFRLLCLARIDPRKGQLNLVRAVGALPEALRRRTTLVLAGTGDANYAAAVKTEAALLEVKVETPGPVPNEALAGLHAGCHAAVLASRTLPRSVEGFGISLLEAAHFGLPVIAHRAGGVGDAVSHGLNGWLVPEGDTQAFSAAIERVLLDDEFRSSLADAAPAWAATFSWTGVASRLTGLALHEEP